LTNEYWIVNARLVDGLGNPAVDSGGIAIKDGRITDVGKHVVAPTGANVLDVDGRTVLPGLINLHSHVFRRKRTDDPRQLSTVAEVVRALRNAHEAAAQGITTARELGARDHLDIQLRDLIEEGGVIGPRILASGRPITRTGGHNHDFAREADGPDEVRKAVRAELKAGADVLKVMASWGGIEIGREHQRLRLLGNPAPAYAAYTVDEMYAAVEEAHMAAKNVTVHAESSEAVLRAVAAGVDSVEHGTHLTQEAADAMAASGTYYVPTISTVFRRVRNVEAGEGADWGDDVMYWASRATDPWMRSLRLAIARGLKIATGTDAGGDIVDEVQLIAEAGLPPLEALRCATGRAAEALGRTDLGALEPGRWADLVVLEGNPDEDLQSLRSVWRVFKAGQQLAIEPTTARELEVAFG
jgi:imidazolonepropionase-like amidohydrolase